MARPSLHLDRSLLLVFPLLFALLHAAVAPAAGPPLAPTDWPQFRGPGGLGVSPAKGLAAEWSGTKNIVWKTELPGPGASSPIVVGQRIFITAYSGYGLDDREPGDPSKLVYHVLCLERASGRIA